MPSRLNNIILICLITLLVSCSCKKQTKECLAHTTAHVAKVTGPNATTPGQETDYVVQYYLSNGCGKFERVESNVDGNTITISLIASYKGCVCTEVLLSGEVTYTFKPGSTGTYYLRFVQPDKTYLIDTVSVN